ncbi:MAG: hypothetical protein ACRDJ4_03485 [Actinomycetota bacterium]
MTELAIAALGVAALFLWVARPLLRRARRPAWPDVADDSRWNELVEAKHSVLRSILDLDHDRAVGKVSAEDFAFLRRQHEAEALALIREMDRLGGPTGGNEKGTATGGSAGSPDDVLEAEIAVARERLRGS